MKKEKRKSVAVIALEKLVLFQNPFSIVQKKKTTSPKL